MSRLTVFYALCLFLAAASGGVAQQRAAQGLLRTPPVAADPAEPIDIEADSLEYLTDRKLIVGTGNVQIREGADLLQADYVTVQTDTRDVYARGNVLMRRAGTLWQGQELRYNLKTRQGDFGEFQAYYDPFYVQAEDSRRISEQHYELKGLTLTTCDGDPPDFSIRAGRATLTDGTKIKARGVMLYYGSVPFFWLPRLNRDLAVSRSYFQFVPGYSSRHGAFLLTAYGYRITPNFKSVTHVDPRSRKGVGLGQDFVWKNTNAPGAYNGEIQTYYIDDQKPFRSPEEEEREKDLVDNERYRVKLIHNHLFTDRTYMLSELNYVSDPEMIKDFFDEEYRGASQPENRASLTYRGDDVTAGLLLNTRLNDFFENVNRLPELSLDATRQQVGKSGLYYESQNRAAWLERVYPDGSDSEDYDAFRIDSSHMLHYPTRHFGFLNLTPRAGYRGTFYSSTFSKQTVTNDIVQTDSNGVVSVTNEVKTLTNDEGEDFRNLYEIGFETSFKAFRTWDDLIVLGDGDGLRHVAEPYLRHTYIPEPNLLPGDLPQFDSVDELDMRHDLRVGMRNKLQTRREKVPVDLVDANIYTIYRIETLEDQEDFSDVFFDIELRLASWLPVDLDGSFDTYDGSFRRFNAAASYLMTDETSIGLEYRYRRDDQNLIALEAILFPNARWSFKAYGRWDTEADGLQEHSYYIQRASRCLGYGIGFRHMVGDDDTEDDYQVWLQIWLLAFPESSIQLGG